jgi:hypothetical protein
LQKVKDLINRIRPDGFCGQVRANALAMVNRRFRVWDNIVWAPNDRGQDAKLLGAAPWIPEQGAAGMDLWVGAFNAWTIAHEAIHGLQNPNSGSGYYTHSNITPLGMNLDATAKYCSGN